MRVPPATRRLQQSAPLSPATERADSKQVATSDSRSVARLRATPIRSFVSSNGREAQQRRASHGRQGLEDCVRIGDGLGDRAGRVKRFGQRHDSGIAQHALAGAMADKSAERCRTANGAGGVGTDGGDTHARAYGGRRSGRRAAGDSLGIDRIFRRTESADHAAAAEGELVHVVLADDHGAGEL